MSALSAKTRELVRNLFPEGVEAVERILIEECGQNLPFCADKDEFQLERFRFAALKISEGNMETLQKAVDAAKRDWRDELVWAGFADHLDAHENWAAQLLTKP